MSFTGFKKALGLGRDEKSFQVPQMPFGVRLNGLVKFKAGFSTYFLLNDGKLNVQAPSDDDCIVKAASSFGIFGLDVYRAHLSSKQPSYLQFNCNGLNVLDTIFFQLVESTNLTSNYKLEQAWKDSLGYKSITWRQKYEYLRSWSADVDLYGDTVPLQQFAEQYFYNTNEILTFTNSAMLYERILEGGTEDDIEYLWTTFKRGSGVYQVELWAGVVVQEGQVEFF